MSWMLRNSDGKPDAMLTEQDALFALYVLVAAKVKAARD